MNERAKATLVVCVLLVGHPSVGMTDFCRNHTLDRPSNGEALHFSKENSDREYGIIDKFKCLHCCTHGYRSIEWFKEGQPYPWPTDVSTLITHPQSGNQTICSQQSTPIDSGRYWCIARNDTHTLHHDVILEISGPSISMGWPRSTYQPRDQTADEGETVRFYCEAFVGTIDLPDFQSEISWERFDLNESFIDGVRVLEESVFREEKRILGSYLTFREVTQDDYGEYTCKVRNLGDQVARLSACLRKRARGEGAQYMGGTNDVRSSFLLVALLVLTAVMSTITLLHFTSYFWVVRNRIFQTRPLLDVSRKDVLVIYHQNDEKEVFKVVPGLRGGSSLHPLYSDLQLGDEDLKAKASSYKAVLGLLSPSLVGQWTCDGIRQVIEALLRLHFTIVCIFSQGLPGQGDEGWTLLKDSLRKVHYLEKKRLKWWTADTPKLFFQRKNSTFTGSSQALI